MTALDGISNIAYCCYFKKKKPVCNDNDLRNVHNVHLTYSTDQTILKLSIVNPYFIHKYHLKLFLKRKLKISTRNGHKRQETSALVEL